MQVIDRRQDLERAMTALSATCPHMSRLAAALGCPPLRREPGGFAGLSRIVNSQMLSLASAEATWQRLVHLVDPFEPPVLAGQSDEALRAAGLSRAKVRTLRSLAAALAEGRLDLDGLAGLPDDEVRRRLVALPGIGPWTADIYLMFCLGRMDGFAPGDLALQEAAGRLLGLDRRPDARALSAIAERWRPYRGVAARLLWSHYRELTGTRSGAPL
ncbi:MAG: DNA-3-methyladenine glycosylase 2 family protein [Hyphomicrobiaceae bacterium]